MIAGLPFYLLVLEVLSCFLLEWDNIFSELTNKQDPFRICCSLLPDTRQPPPVPTYLTRDDSRGQLLYLQHGIKIPVAARNPALLDLCRAQNNSLLDHNAEFKRIVEVFCKVKLRDILDGPAIASLTHVLCLLQEPHPVDAVTLVLGPSGVGKVMHLHTHLR